ncbi:MAG: hypothetical protein WBR26_15670 [Candidatus Acidiferrum sp.]
MSLIRSRAFIGCFLILFLSLVAPANSQAPATAAPGVATGQKIGTIIKTAISTAAPAVSSVLDLIWSFLKKPTATNASKPDLQTAAQNPQAQKTVQQQTSAAAQQKIQPISQVSSELGVINEFLSPSVNATQQLIVVKTKMSEATTDWVAIGNAWALAKVQIGKVKSIPDADLTKVRDAYLSLKLGDIRGANDTSVVSIDQDISQKNLESLKTDVSSLLSVLANMTAVAGYEFAELQADIGDLAKWAQGAAGGGNTKPEQASYISFLNANLK